MCLCLSGRRGNVTCITEHSPSGWIESAKLVYPVCHRPNQTGEHQCGWHRTKNRSVEQLNSVSPFLHIRIIRTLHIRIIILSPWVDALYVSAPFSFLSFPFPPQQNNWPRWLSAAKMGAPWAQFSMSLVRVSLHNWIKKGTSTRNMSGHGANGTAMAVKPTNSQKVNHQCRSIDTSK